MEWIIALFPFVNTGRYAEIGLSSTTFSYMVAILSAAQYFVRVDALTAIDRTSLYRQGYFIKQLFVKHWLRENNDIIRRQATGILLEGKAGVGKTTAALAIVKKLMPDVKRHEVIVLNEDDEFQSELRTHHRVIILDDVLNTHRNWLQTSPMRRVIDMINNVPRRALSPDAELKGTIKIMPELVIITTNVDVDILLKFSECPESLMRRWHRLVVTKTRPFQSSFDTTAWMFDNYTRASWVEKADKNGVIEGYYTDGTRGPRKIASLTFEECLDYLKCEFDRHNVEQRNLVDMVNLAFPEDNFWTRSTGWFSKPSFKSEVLDQDAQTLLKSKQTWWDWMKIQFQLESFKSEAIMDRKHAETYLSCSNILKEYTKYVSFIGMFICENFIILFFPDEFQFGSRRIFFPMNIEALRISLACMLDSIVFLHLDGYYTRDQICKFNEILADPDADHNEAFEQPFDPLFDNANFSHDIDPENGAITSFNDPYWDSFRSESFERSVFISETLNWDVEMFLKMEQKNNDSPEVFLANLKASKEELLAEHRLEEFDSLPQSLLPPPPKQTWWEWIKVQLQLESFKSESVHFNVNISQITINELYVGNSVPMKGVSEYQRDCDSLSSRDLLDDETSSLSFAKKRCDVKYKPIPGFVTEELTKYFPTCSFHSVPSRKENSAQDFAIDFMLKDESKVLIGREVLIPFESRFVSCDLVFKDINDDIYYIIEAKHNGHKAVKLQAEARKEKLEPLFSSHFLELKVGFYVAFMDTITYV
jgi:DNA polymerase III delta prime subunit